MNTPSIAPLLALVVASLAAPLTLAEEQSASEDSRRKSRATLRLTDVSGKTHAPFESKQSLGVALIFVSNTCPIANTFQPTLQELGAKWQERGIPFYLVYSSDRLSAGDIRTHVKDFKIQVPAIPDRSQKLARLTEAKVTPEAIVIDREGRIRYRGLINNLYAGYGKKRVRATQHFLNDACESVANGTVVKVPSTKPLGCFIQYAGK